MSFGKIVLTVLGLSLAFSINAEAKTNVTVEFQFGVPGHYYEPAPGFGHPVPPHRPRFAWKCYAQNLRGYIFPGVSLNQRFAMDRAINNCYDYGSRQCTPIWEECHRVRLRP